MKNSFLATEFVALTLLLAACGSPPATQVAEAEEAANPSPPAGAPSETDTATATQDPTATETPPQNLIQLGDLELVPFAPPWFDGDLATVVFAENGKLRIDAPASPFEPGDEEGLFKSLVFGAVTLAARGDFDVSVTFNRQGGVCTGHDKCANLAATTCIVFGFYDPDNFQIFCIDENNAHWTLDAYVDGIYSSTSNSQATESIRFLSIPIFQYALHPDPNEFRLKMQDNVLSGFINGEQVFQRQGYLPQSCQAVNGMLVCSPGPAGEPCNYAFMEGQAGQNVPSCTDLAGKIGVACFYHLPASIAAEQVTQFGFGIGWDVTNCEVEIALD